VDLTISAMADIYPALIFNQFSETSENFAGMRLRWRESFP
jgi:hypothetical protein